MPCRKPQPSTCPPAMGDERRDGPADRRTIGLGTAWPSGEERVACDNSNCHANHCARSVFGMSFVREPALLSLDALLRPPTLTIASPTKATGTYSSTPRTIDRCARHVTAGRRGSMTWIDARRERQMASRRPPQNDASPPVIFWVAGRRDTAFPSGTFFGNVWVGGSEATNTINLGVFAKNTLQNDPKNTRFLIDFE